MILPKTPKPTARDEKDTYALCELRDNRKCVRCGSNVTPQMDHRRNRQPGNTVPSNIQTLCGPSGAGAGCHVWKTDHPKDAVHDGYAVPSSQYDPIEYPAQRRIFGEDFWVLYADSMDYAIIPTAMALAIRARLGV